MKSRILYVMRIFEQTCEGHPIKMNEILQQLAQLGISAERKSIYQDINTLIDFGMDIITAGRGKYFLTGRTFELPEIRLLSDAVKAAQFISEKKTLSLTEKLRGLCAPYEQQLLPPNTALALSKQAKTDNESIYYTIDLVNHCIANRINLTFNYYEYLVSKEKQLRKQGKIYTVHPLSLVWNDEKYYLIAYDLQGQLLKHFRVDKIASADSLLPAKPIAPYDFDTTAYVKKNFSMFSGRESIVRLAFHNSLIGVVIDRFGEDVLIHSGDEDTFSISVPISVSPQFYGWVFGLGNKAAILSPQWVKEDYDRLKNQ